MKQLLRTVIYAFIGALPGLLLWRFVGRHVPEFMTVCVMAIVLGAIVGAVLSLPQISGWNVLRGFFGIVAASNIPGGSALLEKMLEDGTGGQPLDGSDLKDSRFARATAPASLDDFRDQHLVDIEDLPGSAEAGGINAVVVDDVAPFSLAKIVGLEKGDLITRVDDVVGASIEWDWLNNPAADYTYQFHRPAKGTTWQATLSGAPLGVELSITDERLAALVESDAIGFDELEQLWERRQWQLLKQAAESALQRLSEPEMQPPVNVWLAAAMFEQGQRPAACEMLNHYLEHHRYDFVVSFCAVASYYLAIDALESGDKAHGEELLEDAYDNWKHDRFADAIQQYTGQRPAEEPNPWKGTQLDLNYQLSPLDDRASGKVELATQLRGMNSHQVTTLCVLGGYRGNGPYMRFMRLYRRWFTFFPNFFTQLHVITANGADAPHPEVLEPEGFALAAGVPMQVLFDEADSVAERLDAQFSPLVLFLDNQANVLETGHLSDIELWQLLQQLTTRSES